MKKTKVKPSITKGKKVWLTWDRTLTGKVVKTYKQNNHHYANVAWDDGTKTGEHIVNLELVTSELEVEFAQAKNNISSKLDQAASLLSEATKLANQYKLSLDPYNSPIDTALLEEAISEMGWPTEGWSSSSSYC